MQESRPIRISSDTMVRAILIALGAWVLFLIRDTLLLVLVSIVIASFVEAGVRVFAKYKIGRTLSVPIIFTVVIAIIFLVFYMFVPIIFRELSAMMSLLLGYLPEDAQSIEGATQLVTGLTEDISLNDILVSVREMSSAFSQGATSFIGSAFGGILNTVLVVVMSFYLSIQEKGIDNFLRILTPVKHEKYVLDLWQRTQHKIGIWFKGQLLLGLIMGAVTIVTLALLGVQYAFIIGIITAIAELVPFGVIFAAIPAILFAVIDGGLLLGLKVMIFFIVVQQIENYVLAPAVTKHTVGIPPLVVLLALIIGIALAGFWGAIIAIPVAVFVLEYLSDIEKQKLVPIIDNPDKRL